MRKKSTFTQYSGGDKPATAQASDTDSSAPELPNAYALIYASVLQIPAGRVATYGDIAAMAGLPNHARMVGYALYNLANDSPVPWQRIVNARGICSVDKARPGRGNVQRELLAAEGIAFKANGCIDLQRYRYRWDSA